MKQILAIVMTPYGYIRGLLRSCTDTMSSHGNSSSVSVLAERWPTVWGTVVKLLCSANGTSGNTVVFLRMALRHATPTL